MNTEIFDCKKCGECCKGYGGTFVTETDIKAISDYIRTDPRRFITDYCQMSGSRPVLAQGEREWLLCFLGQTLHHPSGKAADVQGMALYQKRAD